MKVKKVQSFELRKEKNRIAEINTYKVLIIKTIQTQHDPIKLLLTKRCPRALFFCMTTQAAT